MPAINPTEIVHRIKKFDDQASAELLPLIYDQLRIIAANYLRYEAGAQSIQPTDLVHEAYARLVDPTNFKSKDRAHFLAIAARAMRNVLVDHARRRLTDKRGAGWQRISFREDSSSKDSVEITFLDMDDALKRLSGHDKRMAIVVELRYFGGLTIKEVSECLDVTLTSVKDDWQFAKAWLARELNNTDSKTDL